MWWATATNAQAAHGVISIAAAALWQLLSSRAAHAGCPAAPQTSLCTSWSKTRCGHWPLISLCFPGLSLGRLPATQVALSAPQRITRTRQSRSIFRLWRIPLGSPFQSDKVSHCEGEAKTHIRPTDPALTHVHRSELPGLQHFKGGRWLQVHMGRQPKERHQEQRPVLCTAPGAGAPSPGHGLLCGISELGESLGS